MSHRAAYGTEALWDDTPKRTEERREAPRFGVKFEVTIAADDPNHQGRFVETGTVQNISRKGVRVRTNLDLGQCTRATLVVPADLSPDEMKLPQVFVGPAWIMRVHKANGKDGEVGLEFGEAFAENEEFVRYIDYLQVLTESVVAS